MNPPEANTDRELYREDTGHPAGSHYENSLFVTTDGRIGMSVGGSVIVQSIADWHSNSEPPIRANRAWSDEERGVARPAHGDVVFRRVLIGTDVALVAALCLAVLKSVL